MSPGKGSNSSILNNLNQHVDSSDVLFIVSGPAANDVQVASEAFNKRCKSKCLGRKKLNRNFHSKIIDAAEFVPSCDEPKCPKANKSGVSVKASEAITEKTSSNGIGRTFEENQTKRQHSSNRNRPMPRVSPPSKWKREVILRQMKNHRISSATMDMDSRSRHNVKIRPAEKLKVLQDIFDAFVTQNRWDSVSTDSENISGIMNRIGLSKYGFKISNKSPYTTSELKRMKRRPRTFIDIVPRHCCLEHEDSRVPSYMGWHWTKCFSEIANSGWRPGAIPRNIRDIMTYFNGPCCSCMPSDLTTCITYDKKLPPVEHQSPEQVIVKKPTLRVVRRDGLYYVSMNPLKSSDELAHSQDPYIDDCPPIKFQISLNRQHKQQRDDNEMGLLGYPCSEHPAICDDNKEMQDLLKLLADECENDTEFYKLAKTLCSKPSDLDIEFIAPGANVIDKSTYMEGIYKETQYDKNDFQDSFGKTRSLPLLSARKNKKSTA